MVFYVLLGNAMYLYVNKIYMNTNLINKTYYNELSTFETLNKQQIKELYQQINEGNTKAKNKLITSNLKLVIFFAKKYKYLIPTTSAIEFDDVISEGNIGLIKAVDKFNPNLNIKFGYYASYWIKKSIIEFIITQTEQIKVPIAKKLVDDKIQIVINELFQEFQNEINEDDIEQLNMFTDKQINHFFNKPRISALNEEIDYEQTQSNIEDEIDSEIIKKHIKELIKELEPIEINVIQFYYGIGSPVDESFNLRQIGNKLNISHTKVANILHSAHNKLKAVLMP